MRPDIKMNLSECHSNNLTGKLTFFLRPISVRLNSNFEAAGFNSLFGLTIEVTVCDLTKKGKLIGFIRV